MMNGRAAIVTGAAMGLGKEIASALAKAGAKVIIADIEEENGLAAAQEINNLSGGQYAAYCKANVLDEDSIKQVVRFTLSKFGRIDILVNSAGITQAKAIEEIEAQEWDRMMAVNLRGPFLFTKHVLASMKNQNYGRIINMSSIAAVLGGGAVGTAHYAASKAGIVALTKATAKDMGKYGITANAIAPGPCRTRMSDSWVHTDEEKVAKTIPVQRIGEPRDIANAVLFLASQESGFITGHTLFVDGGITIAGSKVIV